MIEYDVARAGRRCVDCDSNFLTRWPLARRCPVCRAVQLRRHSWLLVGLVFGLAIGVIAVVLANDLLAIYRPTWWGFGMGLLAVSAVATLVGLAVVRLLR